MNKVSKGETMETEKIYQGNCIEVLKDFPDESIDCVVTSPPYWGLRDYGTEGVVIGGKEDCDHNFNLKTKKSKNQHRAGMAKNEKYQSFKDKEQPDYYETDVGYCVKCNAQKTQLGLEETPEEFVDNLVKVFSEVKRVLKKEGSVWLNLGDSYHNKSLAGIPFRTAFALQSDGWYLRQDIIWHKPNPMPESVQDRCTKSHEYIFLLTKSPKYFYDIDAIKEKAIYGKDLGLLRSSVVNGNPYGEQAKSRIESGVDSKTAGDGYRNKRSVWKMNTSSVKDAHFATFPIELPITCIKAGCPEGGVVLDPFFGSGTTGIAAQELSRHWVGIELNPEYIEIAERRTSQTTLFV